MRQKHAIHNKHMSINKSMQSKTYNQRHIIEDRMKDKEKHAKSVQATSSNQSFAIKPCNQKHAIRIMQSESANQFKACNQRHVIEEKMQAQTFENMQAKNVQPTSWNQRYAINYMRNQKTPTGTCNQNPDFETKTYDFEP